MTRKPDHREKPKRPESGSSPGLPAFDQVRQWIDLMDERGVEEFEFEKDGVRIRIRRRGGAAAPPPVFESYEPVPAQGEGPVRGEGRRGEPATAEVPLAGEDVHIVKSPIVGTFYAAPQAGAPPFVQLGDRVEVGQVLCIIEAMKLMNEIEADMAGEIVRIYEENGQPVEYGEPLFAIRPSWKK